MKTIIALLAIGMLAGAYYTQTSSGFTESDDRTDQMFMDFIAKFKKSYASSNVLSERKAIFADNLKYIDEHNSENKFTYTLGVNFFADMTDDEVKQKYTGYRKRPVNAGFDMNVKVFNEEEEIKTSLDWRKEGAVNPVVSQGSCGSCWAFSTAAAVEGTYFRATGKLVKFAEQ